MGSYADTAEDARRGGEMQRTPAVMRALLRRGSCTLLSFLGSTSYAAWVAMRGLVTLHSSDARELAPGMPVTPVTHTAAEADTFASASVERGAPSPTPTVAAGARSFDEAMQMLQDMAAASGKRSTNNIVITRRLVELLGLQSTLTMLRYVHIAGTKGKGTTAAYTAALLQAYGKRVGLFTSPHLVDVRERILVDGAMLSKESFARYLFEVHEKLEALKLSDSELAREAACSHNFFRFLFLLALHVFAREKVEVAVVEVGLGGRVDATNVIPAHITVITALGYDHMEVLGYEMSAIAREKAGILKPHCFCYAAPQADHPETRKVILDAARRADARLLFLDADVFPLRQWPVFAIGGRHAVEDSKLAFAAARAVVEVPLPAPMSPLEASVLQTMTFAGRSQVIALGRCTNACDATLYLDGAHTPESLSRATAWFVAASAQRDGDGVAARRVLVLYTSRDPQRVLKSFMPYVHNFCKIIVARISHPRAPEPHVSTASDSDAAPPTLLVQRSSSEQLVYLVECWRNMYREVECLPCAAPFASLGQLLDMVIAPCRPDESATAPVHIFVCGSFYLVGEVLQLVQRFRGDAAVPVLTVGRGPRR